MPKFKHGQTKLKERATLNDILLWIFHDRPPLSNSDARNHSQSQNSNEMASEISSEIPLSEIENCKEQILDLIHKKILIATGHFDRIYDDDGYETPPTWFTFKRRIAPHEKIPPNQQKIPDRIILPREMPVLLDRLNWMLGRFRTTPYDNDTDEPLYNLEEEVYGITVATHDLLSLFPHPDPETFFPQFKNGKEFINLHQANETPKVKKDKQVKIDDSKLERMNAENRNIILMAREEYASLKAKGQENKHTSEIAFIIHAELKIKKELESVRAHLSKNKPLWRI